MPRSAAWGEASAEPGTENRDDDEECRARHESGIGGDAGSDEIARQQAGKQRVCRQDKNNRQKVTANNYANRFQHRLHLQGGAVNTRLKQPRCGL
jgi:hypothetical protein